MSRALTKIQAIIILLVIVIAIVASVVIYNIYKPTTPETPTPTPSPTPTLSPTPTPSPSPTETPVEYKITIGNVTLTVSREFKEFIDKAREGRISIKIYFGHALAEHERPAFQKVISMFEKDYPGIDVEEVPYANMDVLKGQVSAIAALPPEQREQHIGRVPDVFTWAHDWVGSFAEKGWIIPLEEVISDITIIREIRPLFLPIAFESVRYKLKTYGLPYAGESVALIIIKNLVDTIPQTFDDMKNIMERFYDPANERYGLSLQFDPYHIYSFITAFGGYYYDPGKPDPEKFGVNSTGTKQGVEFFIRNVLRYMDYSNLGPEHQLNLFLTGRTPMIITGPWNLARINEVIGLQNIVIIPIPDIDDRTPRPFSGFRNLYITIMARTGGVERLYATVLFVLYVSLNDDAIRILIDENNYVPVKQTMVNYVRNNKDRYPIVFGFLEQVFRSVPMPNDPLMEKAWGVGVYLSAIVGRFTEALAAGKTIDEAIEEAVAIISEKLDEAYASIVAPPSGG